MTKKNDKRLCWNCDGEMNPHLDACPYCGTHVDHSFVPMDIKNSSFEHHLAHAADPLDTEVPTVEKKVEKKIEEDIARSSSKEVSVFLLLVPGVLFALFGFILLLFADEGTLTLTWNQNLSFFYLLGSVPLIYLGYRAMR